MTELLFMLLLGLDSAGISAADFTLLGNFPGSVVSSGYVSGEYPVSAAAGAFADDIVIAGSAYPEAYQWTGGAGLKAPGESGGQVSLARVASGDTALVEVLADPGDTETDEFRWTSGVGIVGLGFEWRFR